jgi:hypothetical protein
MRNIRTAFHEFWSQFFNRDARLPAPVPIPAFQTGYVLFRDAQGRPTVDSPFPYITYELIRTEFAESTIISASIFNRDPINVGNFALVDDVLCQIAKAVPEEKGALLDCGDDGAIWLTRSNPFIDYLPETQEGTTIVDKNITRGIARLVVYNYNF